jgi:methionyl-tRNA formyltransferase
MKDREALRLVMMGTGPFAAPTFRAILQRPERFNVLALFTRPERQVHTHGKARPDQGPMRVLANERGLRVLEPQSINSPEAHAQLTELAADLFVVCDYGQILSREMLGLARLGGINLHGSLLPKYRGAAPINWAIYHGERETGVTVIHMTPKLDAGPCLVQRAIAIGRDETAVELEPRLAELGAPAVLEAIEMLAEGRPGVGIVQDAAAATQAPRLKKSDGLIDWRRSAEQIRNQVRAFQPWPKSYSFLGRDGEPLRVIFDEVALGDAVDQARTEPGTIVAVERESMRIACGEGSILPRTVQPAGKRPMSIGEFLRGHPVKAGDYFASIS